MAKKQEPPAEPAEFTPPGGGGRYQLIDGVPQPVTNAEQANEKPTGE